MKLGDGEGDWEHIKLGVGGDTAGSRDAEGEVQREGGGEWVNG